MSANNFLLPGAGHLFIRCKRLLCLSFKKRLDRFWDDQELKFNWKADIIVQEH